MKKQRKHQLFEMMSKIDSSYKPKLNEDNRGLEAALKQATSDFEMGVVELLEKSYPNFIYARINEKFIPNKGWVDCMDAITEENIRRLHKEGVTHLNLAITDEFEVIKYPDFSMKEVLNASGLKLNEISSRERGERDKEFEKFVKDKTGEDFNYDEYKEYIKTFPPKKEISDLEWEFIKPVNERKINESDVTVGDFSLKILSSKTEDGVVGFGGSVLWKNKPVKFIPLIPGNSKESVINRFNDYVKEVKITKHPKDDRYFYKDKDGERIIGERRRIRESENQSEIDGLSKVVAKNKIYDKVTPLTKGIFRDDAWQNVQKIWKVFESMGLDWYFTDAKYEGFPPKRKRWYFSIDYVGKNGKPEKISGELIAAGAGSDDDPLDKYDITFLLY